MQSVVSNKESLRIWAEAALGTLWEPADWVLTGRDWLKGDFHWTDAFGLLPILSHGQVRAGRIVIGETAARVEKYGRENAAEWFEPISKDFKSAMKENRKWLFDKMRKGYEVHDIKLDRNRADRGPFYKMESTAIRRTKYPVTEVKGIE